RVLCNVTFLSKTQGGRAYGFERAALQGGGYRPHIVIAQPHAPDPSMDEILRSNEGYIAVAFQSAPEVIDFGRPFEAELLILDNHHLGQQPVMLGTMFTIREGVRIVGHGTIVGLGSFEKRHS
ncbi:MAG: hypothetical protein AAF709_22345, partial [Pseudomonadota bacterium]